MKNSDSTINSFKDLIVWQKSMSLVKVVYEISSHFPDEEKFGLISQVRRCAVSIPSNIAEGSKRSTRRDYRSFLRIAFGSLAELETQIILAKDLGFAEENKLLETESLLTEISKMLNTMIKGLET